MGAAKISHKKKYIEFLEKLDSECCALGATQMIYNQNYQLDYIAQNKAKENLTDSFFADIVKSNISLTNLVLIVQKELQENRY